LMRRHADTDLIQVRMRQCVAFAGPWAGCIFRFATVRYANRTDFLAGLGSKKHGGRWNPPGLFNCVYGSLDPQTALAESQATFLAYGIPLDRARPRVLASVSLKLQSVLDLTAHGCLRILRVTQKQLISLDWASEQQTGAEALTQAIGRLAWEEKLEAIIVSSARANGANLVLFPNRRRRGSSWKIQGVRDLPGN
jgi:RES domain-containing protein